MNAYWHRSFFKVVLWVISECCLISIGIDDLVDCAEFTLTDELGKRSERIALLK